MRNHERPCSTFAPPPRTQSPHRPRPGRQAPPDNERASASGPITLDARFPDRAVRDDGDRSDDDADDGAVEDAQQRDEQRGVQVAERVDDVGRADADAESEEPADRFTMREAKSREQHHQRKADGEFFETGTHAEERGEIRAQRELEGGGRDVALVAAA